MNTIVMGLQFGDEGKGKIVDAIAKNHDVVVRFHGGSNAGHTLIVDGVKTVLHLIPSGVLSGKTCVIGNGVAFNPEEFETEIKMLQAAGIDTSLVKVSENAHVVMPYHIELDKHREEQFKIGSTKRGISPCYEDKFARRGVQVKDLFNEDKLCERIYLCKRQTQKDFRIPDGVMLYEAGCLAKEYTTKFSWIEDHVVSSTFLSNYDNIVFEGAQSSLLDVDFGNYPYITSSNCVANYAGVGAGVNLLNKQVDVLGVFKAYMTKVGEGPYPTCIEQSDPALAAHIRATGREFGATTGRPRQIGWLDLDSLKDVCKLNGVTSLALMKSDVLCDLPEVKVKINGKLEEFSGWQNMYNYTFNQFCEIIESHLGIPIKIISYGPERNQTIFR